MKKLVEQYGYCSISPWKSDPYTQLIGSIVSQQLSVKAADTIFSRVKNATAIENIIDPKKLLSLSVENLRSCGLSRGKTSYVIGISEAVTNQKLDFEKLKKLKPQQVIEELIKLKGVGIWTAEMFSMFSLGHPDIFAADDLGIKKGIQKILKLEQLPNKEIMLKHAQIWQPYRSIASWYLWRIVEDKDFRV
jgi:DNA-3-methyladenine glycosylase II